MRRFLIGGIGVLILSLGFWQIVVTDSLITDLIRNALDEKGLQVDIVGLRKGLFFTFESEQLTITKSGEKILSTEQARGRLDLLSLFVFKLPFFFSADLGGGKIVGMIELLHTTNPWEISVDGVNITEIPVFGRLGFLGRGRISGNLKMKNNTGEMRFDLAGAELQSVSRAGITVPLDFFDKGRGFITINGDAFFIQSFVLEGDGIYARIKGSITSGRSSLVLELMPEQSFRHKHTVFSLLEPYRISPGHYSIPLNGN